MAGLAEVINELRSLSERIDTLGKLIPKQSRKWYWLVNAACFMAVGGGCAAYIDWKTSDMVSREEYNLALDEIKRLRRDSDALRETQTMQMADPKWFNKIEAQNKAIREWRANESSTTYGPDRSRVR